MQARHTLRPMTIASTPVSVPTALGTMPAHLWLPPAGRGPGIVLFQEIFGISAYIEKRAADLAQAGYVVLAPEFYWRLGESGVADGPDMLEQGVNLMQRFDWEAGVRDGLAAAGWLREHSAVTGRVGYVGFCFGGGLAFAVAAHSDPDALVSYYGSALPNLLDLAPQVTAPSLHHFGDEDAYIDRETVERIRAAVTGEQTEFYTYPEADHAFDNPDFVNHHPEASVIAWGLTVKFLAKHLPV